MTSEEQKLIERCKKYDSNAQKELYEMYRHKFFGICLQYSNNKEDAKDFFQEGFIKIFSDIRQYQNKGSFEGWMRRVLITTILMEFRKKKKLKFEPLSDSIEHEQISENEQNLEDRFLNSLQEKDLLQSLNSLPPELKIIFNLHCIEKYSHKEISEILNITENNSRIRLLRARKLLRESLNLMFQNNDKKTSIEIFE